MKVCCLINLGMMTRWNFIYKKWHLGQYTIVNAKHNYKSNLITLETTLRMKYIRQLKSLRSKTVPLKSSLKTYAPIYYKSSLIKRLKEKRNPYRINSILSSCKINMIARLMTWWKLSKYCNLHSLELSSLFYVWYASSIAAIKRRRIQMNILNNLMLEIDLLIKIIEAVNRITHCSHLNTSKSIKSRQDHLIRKCRGPRAILGALVNTQGIQEEPEAVKTHQSNHANELILPRIQQSS